MNIVRNNTKEVDSSMQPIAGFIRHLNDNLFRDADVKISEMNWDVEPINSIDLGILRCFCQRIRRRGRRVLPTPSNDAAGTLGGSFTR